MQNTHRHRPTLEPLEDRLVPAFNAVFSPVSSTWILTQVADNGPVTVTVNGANQLQITEGLTNTLGTAGANLSINLLLGTNDLNVQLDTGLTGNLSVYLASGSRNLNMTGAANSIGGNLAVTATTGNQNAELAANAALSVGGSVNMNLGLGDDTVSAAIGANIGGNMMLSGVNHVNHSGDLNVGGNFSQVVSSESVASDYAVAVGGLANIGGSFTYLGNSSSDEIFFTDGGSIGKNVYIDLGTNFDPAFVQELRMNGAAFSIGGNLTLLAGFNFSAQPDRFLTAPTSTIDGNIYINFGEGDSIADFEDAFGGHSITFISGSGSDTVTIGMTGARANFSANLGAGADSLTLNAGASLSSLYVDFGPGVDTFTNNFGAPFNFTARLLNLP